MKAEIKNIFSIDIDKQLKDYQPEISDNFGFRLRMIIGEQGKDGEESFDMMLCTPKWLLDNYKKEEVLFGRHFLIVFEYNYQSIYNKLKNYVEEIDCSSWNEIGERISRIGCWEFEDYSG